MIEKKINSIFTKRRQQFYFYILIKKIISLNHILTVIMSIKEDPQSPQVMNASYRCLCMVLANKANNNDFTYLEKIMHSIHH